MMKHMKKAVSFFMAVCLLAGNSYVGGTSTSVSITPVVQEVQEETTEKQDITDNDRSGIFDKLLHPLRALENLKYSVRTASAEEKEEEEEDYRYVLTILGDEYIENNNSVPAVLNQGQGVITLQRILNGTDEKAASMGNVTCKFESLHPDVIDISSQMDYSAWLISKKPGWAKIHVEITEVAEDGSTNVIHFYATFLVKAQLDRSDETMWIPIDETEEPYLVLDPESEECKDGTYQLKFIGIEDPSTISKSIGFSGASSTVVRVNENGLIKIMGAGMTTLMVQNYAEITNADGSTGMVSSGDPYPVKIIVLPVGEKDGVAEQFYKKDPDVTVKGEDFIGQTGSEVILQTNAYDAYNTLLWEISTIDKKGRIKDTYELKKGEVKGSVITSEGYTLLNYTFEGKNLSLLDAKAGTYQVRAYVTKDYPTAKVPCLSFNVVVHLNLFANKVYLNVGDYYDIMGNSNIPEGMFGKLFSFKYIKPDREVYISSDREKGKVTAISYGSQEIELVYNTNSSDGIFTDDIAKDIKDIVYNIQVIDTLSINPSSAVMYTGGTLTLTANSTQHGTINWKVPEHDLQYITVDNGVVSAHQKTPYDYEATVIAYQIIDGVTKQAECKIQVFETASTIKLEPAQTVIGIGETKSIEAILTPSNLNYVNLKWQSMNEEVFTVSAGTGEASIQIKGIGAGTATLIVINEDNGAMGYCEVTVKERVSKITLDRTSITGKEGDEDRLSATITPGNATDKTLIWSSSDTKVVTVDQEGNLKFGKAGSATIIVRSVDNPSLEPAMCNVTVSKSIGGITLTGGEEIELYVGEKHTVAYKITPEETSNKKLIWESFNPKIVTVSDGVLTAKNPGVATILIMSVEDPSIYITISVTVKQKATSVSMNYKEVIMNVGEFFDMEVTIAPANSTEASLIWESLDTKVATVSSTGRITARAEGTAIVLVKTSNGVTSYCTVKVLEPVTSLELDPTDLIIDVGEVFIIDPVFKPAKPSNMEVKWKSYDTKIATVNSLGEVEGISRGSTVITCESVDGGYRSFCLVTVVNPDIVITVNPDNYRLGYGKSFTLEATVLNKGKEVDNVELIWTSSDESICSVDENGKIYGEDFGDATITVMLDEEGCEAYATCQVRVVREVTSIKLNHTVMTIIKGQTASIEADVQPSNATYTDVTFSSDDEKIAVIDEDGVITAIEVGSTWIWAKAKDNSGKYSRCYVTVIEPVPATGINLSDKQVVLMAGETKKLVYTIKPYNTTDDITWSAGDETIATVDGSGVITARKTGTTMVTIMTSSGKTAQVEVIVIGLSRTTLELPVYTKYSTLTVDGATGNVRWDVADPTICEVNNGVITARKVGTTYVSATVNGRTLRCKVTVAANKKKK